MCGMYTKTIFLTDGNIKCIDQKPLEYITILIPLGEECSELLRDLGKTLLFLINSQSASSPEKKSNTIQHKTTKNSSQQLLLHEALPSFFLHVKIVRS